MSEKSSVFDLRIILQIFAILVTATGICIAIYYNDKRIESEKSVLSLQLTIGPVPNNTVNRDAENYKSMYVFINKGEATTKNVNIIWALNNNFIEYSGKPILVGSPGGAQITILEHTTPGLCELNVKDLPPNAGFTIVVNHKIKKTFAKEIFLSWNRNMFSKDFTQYFLWQINVNGENISIENNGAYALKDMPLK